MTFKQTTKRFNDNSAEDISEHDLAIDSAWSKLPALPSKEELAAIDLVLAQLDDGTIRSAQYNKTSGTWQANLIAKKAILLALKHFHSDTRGACSFDKLPLKFANWTAEDFARAKIRAVPGNVVRYGSHIGPNAIILPSFVNVGAYVDEGTMIDAWATVGSCAQIGKRCHISGGAGIGGVLEPLNASPVIIEDDCFIGARSEIVEGVVVERGSVISMGVYIGASTKIVNRHTKEIVRGKVPAGSVVVPGTIVEENGVGLYAAVIIKTVDESVRNKVSLNDLLREES